MVKAKNLVLIYTVLYTASILSISILSIQKYILIPQVPFFYLLVLPLFVFQCLIFRKYSYYHTLRILYILNICLYSLLAIGTTQLAGTPYFLIYHAVVILLGNHGYRKHIHNLLVIMLSTIAQWAYIAAQLQRSIWITALSVCLSIGVTCIYIFQPYPPIQYQNDIVRIGISPNAEFYDIDFFEVLNTVDLKIAKFVQLGKYHKEYA